MDNARPTRTALIVGIAALVTMAGILVAPSQVQAAGTFDDVPADHIFEDDIAWLAAEGITKGCNPPDNDKFCPDAPVTRGQMAAFLVRALRLESGTINTFSDDNDSVFEDDITKLAYAGITKGCNPPDNDRFCPDAPVTRGQMAAFLSRALFLREDGGGNTFIDDNDSTFEQDVALLAHAGVTKGCNPPDNDKFCPDAPVTRGQMAAFLRRGIELIHWGTVTVTSGSGSAPDVTNWEWTWSETELCADLAPDPGTPNAAEHCRKLWDYEFTDRCVDVAGLFSKGTGSDWDSYTKVTIFRIPPAAAEVVIDRQGHPTKRLTVGPGTPVFVETVKGGPSDYTHVEAYGDKGNLLGSYSFETLPGIGESETTRTCNVIWP